MNDTPKNVKVRLGCLPSVSIGSVLAVLISWGTNHSVVWAILHGFFGWFYVFYRLCGCGGGIDW